VNLPRIGIWSSVLGLSSAEDARATVRGIEELGFGALWIPESVGSKEAMSQAAMLLGWTERIVVATGIANIYARDPMAMANGARALADAYPGRFLLGLGVSHAPSVAARGGDYGAPVTGMRTYLDAMDEALYRAPAPPDYPRVLAALGPRMLELAAERTLGAHPYFVPVSHTAFARETIGQGPLLAPEQGAVLASDASTARRLARGHMRYYLELDNYRRNLLRSGFTDDDVAGDGSDDLVDAIVAWGDADAIAGRVQAHLDAGADHVAVQLLGEDQATLDLAGLGRLAPALLAL
jgi:probable F420-dependent oxidoreductase